MIITIGRECGCDGDEVKLGVDGVVEMVAAYMNVIGK